MLKRFLNRKGEQALQNLKNKRGVTLIQIFFVIIILIVLMVVFSDMNLIRKVTGGNETVAWANELTTLTNSVLTNEIMDQTYGTTIDDNADYILTVPAPPVSAYATVDTYVIDSLVTLTYMDDSTVNVPAPYDLTTYHQSAPLKAKVPTTSYSGSLGIAPFINLSIPKVEESLFLGLLGGADTEMGKYYIENNELDGVLDLTAPTIPAGANQMNALLTLVFGEGDTKNYNTPTPESWVNITLMDTVAMKDILGISNRFLDEDKYRLYWVSSMATENEAIDLVRASDAGLTAQEEADYRKLYQNMSQNILVDTILVMPNSRNDAVYTESSDFNYYKFSAKD